MKIAVYCGSGFGNEPAYMEAAREVGQLIGNNGHSLVYGGGGDGLMGEVAKTASGLGAHVTGVVPGDVAFIADRPQLYCNRVIKAKNMSERKAVMLELADAFIALPGGMGTLDEISEAITLTKIGVMNKKSVFFNKNGFYDPLKNMFQTMMDAGFMKQEDLRLVCFAETASQIADFLTE